MESLAEIELFSRTFDNRFIFNLFDLLLCGVIVLVIVRDWRARLIASETRDRLYLLLGFCFLSASFALGAVFAGAYFFFRESFSEVLFDLPIHALSASAWLMLIASAQKRPALNQSGSAGRRSRESLPLLLLGLLWLSVAFLLVLRLWPGSTAETTGIYLIANYVLDVLNVLLLALALICFHYHPLGKHNFARGALVILLIAASLHLFFLAETGDNSSTIIWDLEQFTWSLALFTFALAIGETGRDLFDRVFVGLQITFILLASLMILVITQTEKADYLASIRARSDELAEFVRANVDYMGREGNLLSDIIQREDFLQRAMLGLGHIPELKIVRVAAGSDLATFEIADDGEINQSLDTFAGRGSLVQPDAKKYFLIHSMALTEAGPGMVEFYGTREVLDRHIRKRIVIIFSIFTGTVVLATFMIGLVVRGASTTIQKQAREIEETQRRLMQASKLAAIGQLAAGVAHEINNPATTILSRASFLLSDNEADLSPSDREDLKAIVTQAQRIAHITNSLLLFSRPQVRSTKAVSIDGAIENSLVPVKEALEKNGISVEKDLEPGLPPARADEASLIRALENLYRNAIDAMSDGGTLHIRSARDGERRDRIRIEISDTGPGIGSEDLPRVFEPFFTTKEVGKGTGLGLAIVHGIIEEHQGEITVQSEPGKKTTFVILLPLEE
jgi:signal transduction histidine kinase